METYVTLDLFWWNFQEIDEDLNDQNNFFEDQLSWKQRSSLNDFWRILQIFSVAMETLLQAWLKFEISSHWFNFFYRKKIRFWPWQSLQFLKLLKGRVQPPSPLDPPVSHWYWRRCNFCTNRLRFVAIKYLTIFTYNGVIQSSRQDTWHLSID